MPRFHPPLLGGLFIGILSLLPFVSAANLCCCLWVVLGGVLTVYLQQQASPVPVESGEAAMSGLMAGAVGGVIYILGMTFLLSSADVGAAIESGLRGAIEQNPQIPAETLARLEGLLTGRNLLVLIGVVTLPMYAIFSMLGSLLGLTIFRKKAPANV